MENTGHTENCIDEQEKQKRVYIYHNTRVLADQYAAYIYANSISFGCVITLSIIKCWICAVHIIRDPTQKYRTIKAN